MRGLIGKNRFMILYLAVILGMATVIKAESAKEVVVAEVKLSLSGKQEVIYCTVTSKIDYLISSQSGAELLWLLPRNTKVKKGDVIAKQNGFFFQNNYEQLKNQLKQSQLDVTFYNKEYFRIKQLSNQFHSETQLEDAKKRYKQAELALRILQQKLDEIKYRLSRLIHYAPEDGEVDSIHASIGEYLQVGQAILELIPTRGRELKCNVSLELYKQNEKSTFNTVTLGDGDQLTLSRVSSLVDQIAQNMTIYFELKESPHLLGERIQVMISLNSEGITEIPYDALSFEQNNQYVWLVVGQTVVKKVEVKILSTKGQYVVVHSELKASEQIVIKGKKRLLPGDAVTIFEKGR